MDLPWAGLRRAAGLADISALGAANLGGTLISGPFWLYIASLLGPEKYGEVGYYVSIASIASVLCLFGSEHALTVYMAKGRSQLWPATVIAAGSSAAAAAALHLMFAEPSISVYTAGYVALVLGGSALLGCKMYVKYSALVILQKALMVAFSISLYYLLGPAGIVLGTGLSMFIFAWPVAGMLRGSRPSFAGFRERVPFSADVYVRGIVVTLDNHLDKLVVASLLGLAQLGGYHLGVQIVWLLLIPPLVVFQYMLPQDASGSPRPALKRAAILVSAAMSAVGFLLAPVVMPVIFPEFGDSVQVVQIMSLAVLPIAVATMKSSGYLAEENGRIVLVSALISLGTLLPLLYMLGSVYGVAGMAVSLLAASTASVSVYLIPNRFMESRT